MAGVTPADPLQQARGVLRRHLLATAALVIGIMLSLLVAEWELTRRSAARMAEQVASRVTAAVSDVVAEIDFSAPDATHDALDEPLHGFLQAGVVVRIKVWLVEGDRVRVVYSDDPRTEGTVRAFSPELAARLDAGETVVKSVPDDAEHRYETALGMELVEAFTGFTDRAGNDMRLEVYVPVPQRDVMASALSLQAPVIGAGLVLMVLVLTWGSVSLARQLRLLAEAQHRAVLYGLRARDAERTELARRLHDGVVQSLAGTRLALDSVRGDSPSDDAVLRRVGQVLGEDTRALRSLLAEYVPVRPASDTLADDLRALTGTDGDGEPRIEVQLADGLRVTDAAAEVLRHAATEGVRNAVRHAGARLVRVRLEPAEDGVALSVLDDGAGLPPTGTAGPGHVGLTLVGGAVRAAGGRMSLGDRTGGGAEFRVWLPTQAPPE